MSKQQGFSESALDSLTAFIRGKVAGVLSSASHQSDRDYTRDYDRMRALLIERVADAQHKLEAAGTGGSRKDQEYDLAWAWHEVDEALHTLATFESRARLAKRRTALGLDYPEKQGRLGT